MSTYIFIENATPLQWTLTNQDGKQEGVIKPYNTYSIKLDFSPTFNRKYFFQSDKQKFNITMDTSGVIRNIMTDNSVKVFGKNSEHHSLYNLLAPHCQHYCYQTDQLVISPYRCHVAGHHENKLLITPNNNTNARVIPPTLVTILDNQEVFSNEIR